MSLMVLIVTLLTIGAAVADTGTLGKVKGDFAGFNPADNTLILSTKNGFVTLNVNANSVFTCRKLILTADQILPGVRVSAAYDRSTGAVISAVVSYARSNGYITSMRVGGDPNSMEIAVTAEGEEPDLLYVTTETYILRDGHVIPASSLKLGDRADAVYSKSNLNVFSLEANTMQGEPRTISGSITMISGPMETGKYQIEVTNADGAYPLTANESTKVWVNGNRSTLGDLQVGHQATVKLDRLRGSAVKIHAEWYAE